MVSFTNNLLADDRRSYLETARLIALDAGLAAAMVREELHAKTDQVSYYESQPFTVIGTVLHAVTGDAATVVPYYQNRARAGKLLALERIGIISDLRQPLLPFEPLLARIAAFEKNRQTFDQGNENWNRGNAGAWIVKPISVLNELGRESELLTAAAQGAFQALSELERSRSREPFASQLGRMSAAGRTSVSIPQLVESTPADTWRLWQSNLTGDRFAPSAVRAMGSLV